MIKINEWNLRSVIGVALFLSETYENTRDNSKYKKFLDILESDFKAKIFDVSGWNCLVIGWTADKKSTKRITKEKYNEFVRNIRNDASILEIEM